MRRTGCGRQLNFKNQINLPETGHWNIKQVQHANVGCRAGNSQKRGPAYDQVQTVGSTTTKRSLIKPNSRHRSFSQLLISAVVNEHQQDTRALSLVCNGNRNSFLIDASVTPDSHQLSVHVAQATLVGTADRSLNRCCRAAVPRLVVDLLFANGINCIPR